MLKRLLLSTLTLLILSATAKATTPLASERWAKVSIDTTGIYEISYEKLRSLGFSDPSKVAVYGSGGIVAADHSFEGPFGEGLAPAPAMHTADGRMLFFAEASVRATMTSERRLTVVRNHYDSKAFYFLSDRHGAPAPLPTSGHEAPSDAVGTHSHIQYFDRQSYSPGKGGAIMLSRPLMQGQTETYGFSLEGYDAAAGIEPSLYAEYGIKISRTENIGIETGAGINLGFVSTPSVYRSTSDSEAYRRGTVSATFTPESGATEGTVVFRSKTDLTGSFTALDFVYIIYRRSNTIGDNSELMMNYSETPEAVALHNAPVDAVVWDVTPGRTPSAPVITHHTNGSATFAPTDNSRRFVAFSPSGNHRTPGQAVAVDNQNLGDSPAPDILIICAPALQPQAEELAAIHRHYQDATVLVAPQDRVFDEFSDGIRTPMAFRRLAKKFYDRDPERFRHIILYGGGTYNNLTLDNSGSMLVTFQAETPDESRNKSYNYCSDQYFAMLDDGFSISRVNNTPMSVNVGRIAVKTPAEGDNYNLKIRRFFERGPQPAAFRRALMYSDDGDKYQHYFQNEESCEALAPADMSIGRVDSYFYPYDKVAHTYPDLVREAGMALTRGVGYMSYCGHGTTKSMGDVITLQSADTYRYDIAPFAMFASCETFQFDRGEFSIVEHMTTDPDGGILCCVASGRSVVLPYNRVLSTNMAQCYADLAPGDTYGDLLRRTRQRILANTTTSIARNTMCYNFCGDPALPVPAPHYGIVLDSTASESFTPRVANRLTGHIADADGNIVDDFNGSIELSLHKAPVRKTNLTDTDSVLTADDCHQILASVAATVTGGRFTADLTVPHTGIAADKHRLSMAAVADDRRCAYGVDSTLAVNAREADPADIDRTPPVIVRTYIDTDDFVPGDITGSDVCFHAVVDPSPSGLRTATGLERSIKIDLDGSQSVPNAPALSRPDADGLVHIAVPFADLAEGRHSIAISVANNAGATAGAMIDFVVGRTSLSAVLGHDAESGVARRDITFTLDGADSADTRLLITDRNGHTVFSRSGCTFPCTWNLTAADGSRVPDGSYRAWVMLSDGNASGSSQAVHFTVLRDRQDNK